MSVPVIRLQEAEITINQNLNSLGDEWPSSVKADFISRVANVINLASVNPNVYPIYRKKNQVKKCVVHPRIALYFKVKNERLYHITFWNSYQHPKNLRLENL